jgi:hypothetical protein
MRLIRAIVVVCAAAVNVHAADTVDLKLRLKPGETYPMRITIEQQITQGTGESARSTTQLIGMGHSYNVQSVDSSGEMKLRLTYNWMRLKRPGVDVDSDLPPKPDANPAIATLTAMVGQSLDVTVTPAGKVTDVKGLDAMVQKVVAKASMDDVKRSMLAQMVRKQYNEQQVKTTIEGGIAIYPDKPVAIGETWTRTMPLDVGVSDSTYKLVGRENGKLTVEMHGTIGQAPGAKPLDMEGTKVTHKVAGEQSGTLIIDEATGWITGGQMKQDINDEVNLESADGKTKQMIPLRMQSTMKFEGKN